MFLTPKKNRSATPKDVRSGPAVPDTVTDQTYQLQEWRRSAQRVRRAWNAWLAAEDGSQAVLYRAYVYALGEEERAAAEVERGRKLAGRPHVVRASESPGR